MIPKYPDFLRNPGSSYEFVTWLRKFLEDDFDGGQRFRASFTQHGLIVVFDGIGAALTTGIKGDVSMPFACNISMWTLLADQSGSLQIDIWKDIYANYPPTVTDTITGGSPPVLSSAGANRDSTLSGWTTSIAEDDTLRFNIDSATTVTRATLVLKLATA